MTTLYVVDTPIGNLADLSDRAKQILKEVPFVIAEDTRRTRKLLSHLEATAQLESFHEGSSERKLENICGAMQSHEKVAVVSDAGSPVVADPAGRLVDKAIQSGCKVVPVPGPSSVHAALAVSGFNADRYLFLGYPPEDSSEEDRWYSRLERAKEVAVIFVPPHDIKTVLENLKRRIPDRFVVAGRELTKKHEEIIRESVRNLADSLGDREIRGEWTLVIAPTAREEKQEEERLDIPRDKIDFLLEEMDLSPSQTARLLAKLFDLDRGNLYDFIIEGNE